MLLDTVMKKYFVGLDKVMDSYAKVPNYPPFNLKKTSDTEYTIEMSVAGFGKTDLDLELSGDKLIIRGNTKNDAEAEDNFIWRGLGLRPFTREFKLNDNLVINNAKLVNGILKITLDAIIPESQKPKKIALEEAND